MDIEEACTETLRAESDIKEGCEETLNTVGLLLTCGLSKLFIPKTSTVNFIHIKIQKETVEEEEEEEEEEEMKKLVRSCLDSIRYDEFIKGDLRAYGSRYFPNAKASIGKNNLFFLDCVKKAKKIAGTDSAQYERFLGNGVKFTIPSPNSYSEKTITIKDALMSLNKKILD